jgi:branched-subunit amino acid aminotransferase/4-amino-4-deoxychorismate lyase
VCKDISIPVRERPVFETEINHADELMIVGTTAEITPIVQINGNIVGKGKPGLITRRLQKEFRNLVLSI